MTFYHCTLRLTSFNQTDYCLLYYIFKTQPSPQLVPQPQRAKEVLDQLFATPTRNPHPNPTPNPTPLDSNTIPLSHHNTPLNTNRTGTLTNSNSNSFYTSNPTPTTPVHHYIAPRSPTHLDDSTHAHNSNSFDPINYSTSTPSTSSVLHSTHEVLYDVNSHLDCQECFDKEEKIAELEEEVASLKKELAAARGNYLFNSNSK